MMKGLFDFYVQHPPVSLVAGASDAERVTDYLAGMTDRFALRATALAEHDLPADAIGVLGPTGSVRIDRLVHDLVEHSRVAGDIVQGPEAGEAMAELRRFMFDEVYLGPEARREAEKVDQLVHALFDTYVREPSRLPPPVVEADLPQRVTDYIAGMTDRFATRIYAQLKVPTEFAS